MVELVGSNIISLNSRYQNISSQTSESLRQAFLDNHREKQKEYLEKIMKDKPFSSSEPYINYEEIKYIVPIDYTRSTTGEVFRIEMNNGKKYKIRKCRSFGEDVSGKKRAQEIDENISGLYDVFPKYYGYEESYLLFDWVDNLKTISQEESPYKYEKIGELIAKVHSKQPILERKNNFDRRLRKRTDYNMFSFEFTRSQLNCIKEKVNQGLSNPNLEFGLDPWDLTSANVKFTSEGNPIIIDEESIDYAIKGVSLGKAMKWSDFDRDSMKKGYESVKESKYLFEKNFLDFIYFFMLLNTLRVKKMNNEDCSDIKDRILKIL